MQQQQRPLAKRSACDRCRQHKLRCSRSQSQGDEPCVRCVRAAASCVTGAAQPLGRPRLNPVVQRRASRRSRHSIFVPVTVPRTASEPEPQSSAESALDLAAPQSRSGSSEDFRNPFTVDSEIPSMFLGEGETQRNTLVVLEDTPCRGFQSDTLALSDLVSGPNLSPFDLDTELHQTRNEPLAMTKSLPSLPDTNPLAFSVDPAFQLQYLPNSALDISNRSPVSLGSPHVLSRFALLNDGIARQLSNIESFAWGIPAPDAMADCVDHVEDREVNPILKALESTSELAAIIKHVISPIQEQVPTPLTTPVMLMCLSGYIQLLQMYNTIFFHVHRMLSSLHDVVAFFDSMPGLTHISGLPPIKGDLYIKIVVQVAQHNISSVERVMGLPSELCLSVQRPSSKSLFGYVDSPDLFESIMDQACNPSEKSGRALIASLRTNIGKVLGLLREDC